MIYQDVTATPVPTPAAQPTATPSPDFSYLASLPTWLAAGIVTAAILIPVLTLFGPSIRDSLAARSAAKRSGAHAEHPRPSDLLAQAQDRTDEYIRYLRTENETLRVELGEMRRQIKGLEDEIDRLNQRLWRHGPTGRGS